MQGGMQSLEETIARGVPVIAIPFFSDQKTNADKICDLNIGQRLTFEDLTKEALTTKIHEVINNPVYREESKKLGNLIRDTPMTPVETAVWSIEYAIRNRGAKHLKYKAAKISFTEYFLLDVIFVHVFVMIFVAFLTVKTLKMCQSKRSSVKSSEKLKLK